jgi:hypothetical protein
VQGYELGVGDSPISRFALLNEKSWVERPGDYRIHNHVISAVDICAGRDREELALAAGKPRPTLTLS